jgi:hypothetical protein
MTGCRTFPTNWDPAVRCAAKSPTYGRRCSVVQSPRAVVQPSACPMQRHQRVRGLSVVNAWSRANPVLEGPGTDRVPLRPYRRCLCCGDESVIANAVADYRMPELDRQRAKEGIARHRATLFFDARHRPLTCVPHISDLSARFAPPGAGRTPVPASLAAFSFYG